MGNIFSIGTEQAKRATVELAEFNGLDVEDAVFQEIRTDMTNYPVNKDTLFFTLCSPERGAVSILPHPGGSVLTLDRKNAIALIGMIENAFNVMGMPLHPHKPGLEGAE